MDSQRVYNLVCKYCTNNLRFAKFDEFLQHAQEQHGNGRTIGLNDLAIVLENSSMPISEQMQICEIDNNEKEEEAKQQTSVGIMQKVDNSDKKRSQTPFVKNVHNTASTTIGYDLRALSRNCLIDISQLLSKCLCIWHKPTRATMTRRDRFHAYQLLLRKLREYVPEAKFRDARGIVRQIIVAFLEEERGTNSDNSQLEPIKSRTMLEQLLFLSSANTNDIKELEIDKFCAFCNTGFYSVISLFSHMVQHHLPTSRRKQTQPTTSTTAMAIASTTAPATAMMAAATSRISMQTSSALARSSIYSLRSKSHLSTHYNSECETDFGTDRSEYDFYQHIPKRIRRKSKRESANKRDAKRLKRRHDLFSHKNSVERQRQRSSLNISHSCLKCTKSFRRLHYLSSHVLRMHPPTCCGCCGINCETADQLKQHLLQQHSQEPTCPICSKANNWQTPAHLAEHFYNHVCGVCMATFHDAKQYRQHKFICRQRDRLRCWHCAENFKSIQELRQHAKSLHQEYQPFKCGMCERRYKFLAPLVRHEHWHKRVARA